MSKTQPNPTVISACTPQEKFDQALKTSIRGPYDDLLSFSVNADAFTVLELRADLLKKETMFSDLVTILKTELPTRALMVYLQPHDDYKVEDRFTSLHDSLKDNDQSIEIIQVLCEEHKEHGSSWKKYTLIVGGAAVAAFAAPAAATFAVGALGFTSAGISASSIGAAIMSAYGGAVGTGSICAILQSIGAAGLGTAATAFFSTIGAFFGAAGARAYSDQQDKKRRSNDAENNTHGQHSQSKEKTDESATNDESKENDDKNQRRNSPGDEAEAGWGVSSTWQKFKETGKARAKVLFDQFGKKEGESNNAERDNATSQQHTKNEEKIDKLPTNGETKENTNDNQERESSDDGAKAGWSVYSAWNKVKETGVSIRQNTVQGVRDTVEKVNKKLSNKSEDKNERTSAEES